MGLTRAIIPLLINTVVVSRRFTLKNMIHTAMSRPNALLKHPILTMLQGADFPTMVRHCDLNLGPHNGAGLWCPWL
jgi:hypothetical protein